MKVECIGVGEAFDPKLGNASYLIHAKTKLLIDCGYAVPRNFFSKNYPPDFIDGIYITHFHADHFFGLPPLLSRWNEDGRTKPLTLLGQPGTESLINQVIDLGYPGSRSRLKFALRYLEGLEPCDFNEMKLFFAQSDHLMKNLAVRVSIGDISIGFSGDGGLTEKTRSLFQECRLLIHEAYRYDQSIAGHTNALDIVQFAKTVPSLVTLALVHIQREERTLRWEAFQKLKEKVSFRLIIPLPGDELTVP